MPITLEDVVIVDPSDVSYEGCASEVEGGGDDGNPDNPPPPPLPQEFFSISFFSRHYFSRQFFL